MDLPTLTASAWARIPATFKGPVTFTTADGVSATTGMAVGVPAHGSGSDTFRERATLRARARSLTVLSDGLTFAPLTGMTASWEASTWSVLTAVPVTTPVGGRVAFYRVVLER